jgi:hypothetical protein
MFQDDPNNPGNHGYVVSHVGLNNDANWRDFREFDLEDQQVFRDWLESQEGDTAEGNGTSGGGSPRRFDEDMLVHGEVLSDFVRQSFLDPKDDRVVDRILDATIPGVGLPFREFMTREQVREMLNKAQAKMLEGSPETIPVSPQRRRQAARQRLADRPRSVAARVIKDLKMAPQGYEISRLIPEAKGSPNLIAAIRLIQGRVNKEMNIDTKQRNKPSAKEAEATLDRLDQIGDEIVRQIKTARKAGK